MTQFERQIRVCMWISVLALSFGTKAHATVAVSFHAGAERLTVTQPVTKSEADQALANNNGEAWNSGELVGSRMQVAISGEFFKCECWELGVHAAKDVLKGRVAEGSQSLTSAEWGAVTKLGLPMGNWQLFLEANTAVEGSFRYDSAFKSDLGRAGSKKEVYTGVFSSARGGFGVTYRPISHVRIEIGVEFGRMLTTFDERYEIDFEDGAPYTVAVPEGFTKQTLSTQSAYSAVILSI